MTGRTPRCSSASCRAELRWVVTQQGNRMPLDIEPNPEGNVEVIDIGIGHRPVVVVHPSPPLVVEGVLYMPHHATCPEGRTWRKPRPRT